MTSAKERVQRLFDTLAEEVTLEDIQYHLCVLQRIELGLADLDAGRVVPHEEVKRRMARWTEKVSGSEDT